MLEGDLGDFTLSEVLQLLAFTSKSGRLDLHGPHTAGRIVLVHGRPVEVTADVASLGVARRLLSLGHVGPEPIEAALAAADELPGDRALLDELVSRGVLDQGRADEVAREAVVDAMAALLSWRQGAFRFVAAPAPPVAVDAQGATGLTVDELIERAHVRLRELDELDRRLGGGAQSVTLTAPVPETSTTVPGAAWGVLPFVDGTRTVDELAAVTGRGALELRRLLLELREAGLVLVETPAGARGGVLGALDRVRAFEERHEPGARATTPADEPVPSAAPTDQPVSTAASIDQPEVSDEIAVPAVAPALTSSPAPADDHVPAADPVPADVPGFAEDPAPGDEPVPVGEAATAGSLQQEPPAPEAPPAPPAPLRARVRTDRLRPDPSVDEELVARLIDGVEEL